MLNYRVRVKKEVCESNILHDNLKLGNKGEMREMGLQRRAKGDTSGFENLRSIVMYVRMN